MNIKKIELFCYERDFMTFHSDVKQAGTQVKWTFLSSCKPA